MIQYYVKKHKQYKFKRWAMDIQPANQSQPVSDDQELAKVLAGVNGDQAAPAQPETTDNTASQSGLQFEESPVPPAAPAVSTPEPTPAPAAEPLTLPEPSTAPAPSSPSTPSAGSPELESIKKDALEELRPLVTKLDLPADEKFDTLLLIIRSTDDQSLLGAAHDAAKTIPDESRRAQALLDVIKEIDYFSSQGGATS
jgi:hypothetical protein